jgi:hypothetical protein
MKYHNSTKRIFIMDGFNYFVHKTAGIVEDMSSIPDNSALGGFYSMELAIKFGNMEKDNVNFVGVYDNNGELLMVLSESNQSNFTTPKSVKNIFVILRDKTQHKLTEEQKEARNLPDSNLFQVGDMFTYRDENGFSTSQIDVVAVVVQSITQLETPEASPIPEASPESIRGLLPEASPAPEAISEAAPEAISEAAPEAIPEAAPEAVPEAAPEAPPEAAPAPQTPLDMLSSLNQ